MLAFKLPQSLYERYMREAHHDAPLREEQKLADTADMIAQQASAMGANVARGDGMSELGQNRQALFEV